MRFILGIVLASTLLASCVSAPERKIVDGPFFNLRTYFQEEIPKLKAKTPIRKQVTVNGETEEQLLDSINFERELRAFSESDINKPAWFDSYSIDSILTNGQLKQLQYRALKEEFRTREIDIDWTNGKQVEQIRILRRSESPLAKSKQELIYRPQERYQIRSWQEIQFGEDTEILIEVFFFR
jgi:hypothetical protein